MLWPVAKTKQCQRTRQHYTFVLQSIMNESYMIVRVTDTHARGLELEKLKRAPVMPTPARHCSRSRPVIHRQHSILGFGSRETTGCGPFPSSLQNTMLGSDCESRLLFEPEPPTHAGDVYWLPVLCHIHYRKGALKLRDG